MAMAEGIWDRPILTEAGGFCAAVMPSTIQGKGKTLPGVGDNIALPQLQEGIRKTKTEVTMAECNQITIGHMNE